MDQTSRPSFEDLPYFQDYLEQVLRPRVAALIEQLEGRLTETAWAFLAENIGQTPRGGMTVEQVRGLLENSLGLALRINVEAAIASAAGEAGGDGEAGPAGDGRESVVVSRTPLRDPLARAVAGIRSAR